MVKKGKKNQSIFINDTKIFNQNTVKYLGVTIDKHLKWKPHIDELTSNVSKSVSILYYLQKYLKLVYHALVKSKLHYGILLWENAYKTTLSISKSVSILYYLQKYLKLVYHALAKSKLHYGILLWENAYKTTLSNLNKIHNRALRYITKLPYRTNIDKLFANANLLKINKLYKFTASKYMFKLLLYNNGPKKDMQLLSKIHTHNTRQ